MWIWSYVAGCDAKRLAAGRRRGADIGSPASSGLGHITFAGRVLVMLRARHWIGSGLLALAACESAAVDPAGSVLHVQFQPAAGVVLNTIDEAHVRIEGPSPRSQVLAPGTTQTFDGLLPGTYSVILEGLIGGEVETFGERTGVVVTAGRNTNVTVPLQSFVPVLGTLPPSGTVGQTLSIQFSGVAGATGYRVEVATNAAFTNAQIADVATTSVDITLNAQATFFVRVRARNRFGSLGRPSASGSIIAGPPPAIALALAPPAASAPQGSTIPVVATVTRSGGFTGTVAFVVLAAPQGVTVTFAGVQTIGGVTTATLNIIVTASAAPGSYALLFRAFADGVANADVAFQLTITAAAAGNTTFRFCSLTGAPPLWFAAQDGNGAWSRVSGVNDTYTFDIGTRGGIAYVQSYPNFTLLVIQYGTQAELNALSAQCVGAPQSRTVNGSVANVSSTELAWISHSGFLTGVDGNAGNPNFQMTLLEGPRDLIASRMTVPPGARRVMNRGILRRGVNAATLSTLPVLDFNAAEAFTPAFANVTITGLGADLADVRMAYYTASGWAGLYFSEGIVSSGITRQYPGIPAVRQMAGDLHRLEVSASPRYVTRMFRDVTDQTIALGPQLNPVTVSTVANAAYVQLRTQYTIQAEYNKYFVVSFNQSDRYALVAATAGYLGGAAALDVAIPNFTGVAGWDNQWSLAAGSVVQWQFQAYGWTHPAGGVEAPYAEGVIWRQANGVGTITP